MGKMKSNGKFLIAAIILVIFIFVVVLNTQTVFSLINGENSAPDTALACGDTIVANTTLTADLFNCPGNGIVIGVNNIELNCNSHVISGNRVGYGISATSKQNITVRNCIVQNFSYGIFFTLSSNNILINNIVSLNGYGIRLQSSSNNNTLTNNTANSNGNYGIYLYASSNNNNLINNTANSNYVEIYVQTSSNNILTGNMVTGNKTDLINDDGIILSSSNNNILTSNTANSNIYGIGLMGSSNNTLINNIANSNSYIGIYFTLSSSNNILTSNTANSNIYGIGLAFSSDKNTITSNTMNSNVVRGIYFSLSSNNIIKSNTILNNTGKGIQFSSSNNNIIFNNFFNNSVNAEDDGINLWNTTKTAGTNIIGGSFIAGNFWHDYAGRDTDGDGLGDTKLPYNSSNNITNGGDFAPLVMPFSYLCGDLNNDGVRDVLDVVFLIDYVFKGGTPPNPLWIADLNGDGSSDGLDVVMLIDYVFRGGPEPTCTAGVNIVQASTTLTLAKANDGFSVSSNFDRDVAGMQFDLTYDAAKVKILGVKGTTMTSGMAITNTQVGIGKSRIGFYDGDGSKYIKLGSGTLFTIQASGSDLSSLEISPVVVDYETKKKFSIVNVDNKLITKPLQSKFLEVI